MRTMWHQGAGTYNSTVLSQQIWGDESCFGQKLSGKTCCQTSPFLLRMSAKASKWTQGRNQPQHRYPDLGEIRNKGDSEQHFGFCLALDSVPPCIASHSA